MPVFPAAAVGNDQITTREVRPDLAGQLLGPDLGGEHAETLPDRIDVPEKNEVVDAEDVAGLFHLLGADPPEVFARMASAGPPFPPGEAEHRDPDMPFLQLADQAGAEDLVVRMRDDDGDAAQPPDPPESGALLFIFPRAQAPEKIAGPLPVEDRISEPLGDFAEQFHGG